jgi:hypothetical protein
MSKGIQMGVYEQEAKTKEDLEKGKRSVLLLNPVDNLTFSQLELATLRPFYYVTSSTHCTTRKWHAVLNRD